jgi:hypothetical protein
MGHVTTTINAPHRRLSRNRYKSKALLNRKIGVPHYVMLSRLLRCATNDPSPAFCIPILWVQCICNHCQASKAYQVLAHPIKNAPCMHANRSDCDATHVVGHRPHQRNTRHSRKAPCRCLMCALRHHAHATSIPSRVHTTSTHPGEPQQPTRVQTHTDTHASTQLRPIKNQPHSRLGRPTPVTRMATSSAPKMEPIKATALLALLDHHTLPAMAPAVFHHLSLLRHRAYHRSPQADITQPYTTNTVTSTNACPATPTDYSAQHCHSRPQLLLTSSYSPVRRVLVWPSPLATQSYPTPRTPSPRKH